VVHSGSCQWITKGVVLKKLVPCFDSFLMGAFASFTVMMLITGFVITRGFVAKQSLLTKIVYIDGKTYDIKERK